MTSTAAFILAAFSLLVTPGPTNTLLATAGASSGFIRSMHLLAAEVTAYLFSITFLATIIGPLANNSPLIALGLKISCAFFLAFTALKLMRSKSQIIDSGTAVRFRDVLFVTLLNPKGAVFAFVIVPYLGEGQVKHAAPYLAALSALIIIVGGAWIGLGAMLRKGSRGQLSAHLVYQVGGFILIGFAGILLVSAVRDGLV